MFYHSISYTFRLRLFHIYSRVEIWLDPQKLDPEKPWRSSYRQSNWSTSWSSCHATARGSSSSPRLASCRCRHSEFCENCSSITITPMGLSWAGQTEPPKRKNWPKVIFFRYFHFLNTVYLRHCYSNSKLLLHLACLCKPTELIFRHQHPGCHSWSSAWSSPEHERLPLQEFAMPHHRRGWSNLGRWVRGRIETDCQTSAKWVLQ